MEKVRICLSAYLNNDIKKIDSLYCCVYSILAQTYENFEIYIHHDGPLKDTTLKNKFESINDKIKFIDNLEHKGHWGHYHRRPTAILEPECDWILFTNDDNYYVPVFIETMLNTAYYNNAGMVYCDMIHNYENYNISVTDPDKNLDMGAFMTRTEIIKNTTWDSYVHNADWQYANKLSKMTKSVKAPGILFVHN